MDIIGPTIPLILFMLGRQKIRGELKLIFLFCVIQFICNIMAEVFGVKYFGNNYWVYKINTVASFGILLILFGKYLVPVGKTGGILLTLAFISFTTVPVIYGDGISTFNSYSASLASLSIVASCLYYFYTKLIHASPEESVISTSIFWCVVGLFIYYAGAFFVFISYKLLIEQIAGKSVGTLWKLQNFLLFVCCIYISYGILCKNYQKISLSY